MKSTKLNTAGLATHRIPPVDERIARRRLAVALSSIAERTPLPGHAWYDITRSGDVQPW